MRRPSWRIYCGGRGSVLFVPQAAIKEHDDPEKDRPCGNPMQKLILLHPRPPTFKSSNPMNPYFQKREKKDNPPPPILPIFSSLYALILSFFGCWLKANLNLWLSLILSRLTCIMYKVNYRLIYCSSSNFQTRFRSLFCQIARCKSLALLSFRVPCEVSKMFYTYIFIS